VPTQFAEQWPIIAVLVMAIIALYGLSVKLFYDRLADIKAACEQQLKDKDRTIERILTERNALMASETKQIEGIFQYSAALRELKEAIRDSRRRSSG
jgi:predicted Holliday junction resolvase-like endonuclease